jgi:hypothetical protein
MHWTARDFDVSERGFVRVITTVPGLVAETGS